MTRTFDETPDRQPSDTPEEPSNLPDFLNKPRGRGRPPLHPDASEPESDDAFPEPRPYRVWVEGEVIVQGGDGMHRVTLDQLRTAARALGLKVFTQKHNPHTAVTARHYRQMTRVRVSIVTLFHYMREYPGSSIIQLAEMVEPGLTADRAPAAHARIRAALYRARDKHLVLQRGSRYYLAKPEHTELTDARISYMTALLENRFGSRSIWAPVATYIAEEMARAEPIRTWIAPAQFAVIVTLLGGMTAASEKIGWFIGKIRGCLESGVEGYSEVIRVEHAIPPSLIPIAFRSPWAPPDETQVTTDPNSEPAALESPGEPQTPATA